MIERPWGERSFYVVDPWGNDLCFCARRDALHVAMPGRPGCGRAINGVLPAPMCAPNAVPGCRLRHPRHAGRGRACLPLFAPCDLLPATERRTRVRSVSVGTTGGVVWTLFRDRGIRPGSRMPVGASPAYGRSTSEQAPSSVTVGLRRTTWCVRVDGSALPDGDRPSRPVRPARARRHLRGPRLRRAARRPRRGRDELRHRRRRVEAGAAVHPWPDRVVVGLRGGDAPARRALPGVRRRPARSGPQHPHARPLHARQHGQ